MNYCKRHKKWYKNNCPDCASEGIIVLIALFLFGFVWKLPRYLYVRSAKKHGNKKRCIQTVALYYISILIFLPIAIDGILDHIFGYVDATQTVLIVFAVGILISLIAWHVFGSPEVEFSNEEEMEREADTGYEKDFDIEKFELPKREKTEAPHAQLFNDEERQNMLADAFGIDKKQTAKSGHPKHKI
jgi:hypothetical protein